MESEDFIPMESLLEVSLVEGGQQICANEGIEEITIDEPATNNFLPEERQTDSSSFIVIVDDGDEPQDVLGTPTSAATIAAKFSLSSPVNAGGVADEAQPSMLSAEDGKNDKSQSLSTNNLMATRISDEEKSFYKEMFKDPSAVCKMRLHCTACDRHMGLSTKTVVFSHRIMRVLLCQRCYLFYDTGEFQQGDDGSDMFCRWCGQGGRLICCSLCSNVFCEKCISRNFGTTQLRRIKKADDWFCFVCNLKSLWPARATCAELKKAVAELKSHSFHTPRWAAPLAQLSPQHPSWVSVAGLRRRTPPLPTLALRRGSARLLTRNFARDSAAPATLSPGNSATGELLTEHSELTPLSRPPSSF
ncbi:uncharacterized protein LOC134531881 isoform X2 [Bacillus rossius redtenbacheri]|uniref:uncharacterized protein LOC134531881 isoform X2 n=1 Tax=Bacillus rossius redtenbacheri TaxID=93214 RepID=UPI002FDD617C